jgi:hypothetical protein
MTNKWTFTPGIGDIFQPKHSEAFEIRQVEGNVLTGFIVTREDGQKYEVSPLHVLKRSTVSHLRIFSGWAR